MTSLISFTGSMLLHVIVVWLCHHYKHRHPNTSHWWGLFRPEKPQATSCNCCSEAAPAYSDALSLVPVLAPDYSVKVRTLSQTQSQQSPRAIFYSTPASNQEVFLTAPPVENVQNIGRKLNAYCAAFLFKVKQMCFVSSLVLFRTVGTRTWSFSWKHEWNQSNRFESFNHWNHFHICNCRAVTFRKIYRLLWTGPLCIGNATTAFWILNLRLP